MPIRRLLCYLIWHSVFRCITNSTYVYQRNNGCKHMRAHVDVPPTACISPAHHQEGPDDIHVLACAGSAPEDKGAGNMLLLGVLFAGWYGANIVFNM